MKKKSGKFINVFLILILLVGLSLLLYPTFSDYWNSFHQSKAITQYASQVDKLSKKQYKKLWKAAKKYNKSLAQNGTNYKLTAEQKKKYESLLNVEGTGVIGYIEIPKIQCNLPIYHGTDEAVLQTAIGHLEWTSLPTGGKSTHCVLSGHRGLPSAKLFTDLDKMEKGDVFMIRVLNEVLTYEVDRILIVEPQETQALQIEKGKDYCTLVTCTPYGINTHRLLVRGHRIENINESKNIRVTADAVQIKPIIVAPIIAIPILLILLIVSLILPKSNKKSRGEHIDEM